MRALLLCVILLLTVGQVRAQQDDPVLMTVGGTEITLSEFETIYRKNNDQANTIDKKSLEEYLELYINFKLKVKAAESLGMDTAGTFKSELAGYRAQLAKPYLIDKKLNDDLIREAYDRMTEDISASHILVKVAPDALPKDTLKAYSRTIEIRKKALNGQAFDALAKEYSEDPSAAENSGYLGYFSAFSMVYPFETAAYRTKVGEVSMPVRTRFGYHLVMVKDRRKARGQIKVAHILVRGDQQNGAAEDEQLKAKVDEIYAMLETTPFDVVAKQHSADPGSAPNGGALPWFGTGRMVAEFEEASFALENDGDISKPFRTQYGWHIVKRLERKGVGTFEDAKFELKRRVERDIRGNQSRTSLIRNIKRDYQFTEDREAKQRFYTVLTEDYFRGAWKAAEAAKGLDKMLFRLKDETYNPREVVYTQQDFANFLERTQRRQPIVDVRGVVDTKYQQFMEESCIAFENDNLEYKYPEFRALMREYRDGILLFELMDEKVWSKAVKDSAGLEQFHQAHQQDFMWEDRVDAHIYTCANEAVAAKVRKLVKKRASKGYSNKDILDKVNVESQLNLKIESGKFQQGDNATVDQVARKKGLSDNIPVNGQVAVVQINALLPASPKALAEARGMVTASYQTYLEEQWIEELRKKYPVSVDRSVLSTIK